MNPNFFIVGGSKCGTTNISHYLNEHPDVFISKLNEPYYFSRFDILKDFVRESMVTNFEKYLDLFKDAENHKAVGEASSVYLSAPNAASEIKKAFPNSKIIISIRNPIERAHSSYFSYQFMHHKKETFSEMIELHEKQIKKNEFFIYNILEPGFYTKHIKRFQEIFEPEKIKIIIFEDYIKNTNESINSIFSFLGIDKKNDLVEQSKGAYRVPKNNFSGKLLKNSTFRKLTTKLVPTVSRQKIGDRFLLKQTKKPEMLETERTRLKEVYKDEFTRLQKLLNIKLPWKDFIE